MELTKEQIQFIDHRLENEGIKYWDIRIEMLDHVVSDLENKLTPETSEYDFKELVQDAFENLGWKENFNGSGFEKVLKENFKNIGLQNRTNFKEEFAAFFNNGKILAISIFLLVCYYLSSNFISHKQFVNTSSILFIIPAIYIIYEFIKISRKKIGKSFHKDQGLGNLFASFGIFFIVFQTMGAEGTDFSIPIIYQKPVLFIVVPIHLVLSYIGYKVYKKTIVKVVAMRKQLLS